MQDVRKRWHKIVRDWHVACHHARGGCGWRFGLQEQCAAGQEGASGRVTLRIRSEVSSVVQTHEALRPVHIPSCNSFFESKASSSSQKVKVNKQRCGEETEILCCVLGVGVSRHDASDPAWPAKGNLTVFFPVSSFSHIADDIFSPHTTPTTHPNHRRFCTYYSSPLHTHRPPSQWLSRELTRS